MHKENVLHSNSRVFLVILHNLPFHLSILRWYELEGGQIRVIGIVFSNEISTFSLNNVTGHQGSRVLVALHHPLSQIPLDLKTEQIPGKLLFQLPRIRGVKFDAEVEQGVYQREAQLTGQGLLQVQPILKN